MTCRAFEGARSAFTGISGNTTLEFAAFPRRDKGRLKYCASNHVGDAVMLYSCVLGPVWQRVKEGKR